MNKRKYRGSTLIGLMLGMGLITIAVTGALKLLGISMSAQNGLNTESLVDQINRISEIVTVHLNRGGSFKNPDVEAKGIQLCSLPSSSTQCSTYTPNGGNFCLSIPTRVSIGGQDVINLTGFRLFNGVLAQRELNNVNMAQFNHRNFCNDDSTWTNLNDSEDFKFTALRFCKFKAETPQQVTSDYEQSCDSVIENDPKNNMFWLALFKAKIDNNLATGVYEEARVIHLLNTTRVRDGS